MSRFKLQLQVTEVFNWLTETMDLPNVHLPSFFLILTGWVYLKHDMLFKCNYCNRKWSLEPYIARHPLTANETNQEQSTVNPITQHQRWCAWRSSGAECGWESRLTQLLQLKESQVHGKRSRLSTEAYVSCLHPMSESSYFKTYFHHQNSFNLFRRL